MEFRRFCCLAGNFSFPHGEKKSLTVRELVIDTLPPMNFNIENKNFKILNPLPDGLR
jgi:hypothetical protein